MFRAVTEAGAVHDCDCYGDALKHNPVAIVDTVQRIVHMPLNGMEQAQAMSKRQRWIGIAERALGLDLRAWRWGRYTP